MGPPESRKISREGDGVDSRSLLPASLPLFRLSHGAESLGCAEGVEGRRNATVFTT